jgi:hypothetical protein
LKAEKRQVRLLYAPYDQTIVLFRIHKEGSPQEQSRAYELAKSRKGQYEVLRQYDCAISQIAAEPEIIECVNAEAIDPSDA